MNETQPVKPPPKRVEEHPITAQPVGNRYFVATRGDREYDHVAMNEGCYQRRPTCKD